MSWRVFPLLLGLALSAISQTTSSAQAPTSAPSIFDATLNEAGAKAAEITTN